MAEDAPERLIFIVIISADDGQDHLVCERVALRTYRAGFAGGFPAVCGATVHPPEAGWESGPSLAPTRGTTLCRPCVARLPQGAFIRGEPGRSVGELPVPRGGNRRG